MDGFSNVHFWDMTFRSILAFLTILILTRIIGKKQLSQLTFFHYVTGITFGSIAAQISTQHDAHFWDGFISLIWWTILTLLISFISLKSTWARKVFEGRPTILIQNGTIIQNGMKKARLHTDELSMLLREQGIFSFDEVLHAVFETNGELSILKKPVYASATKQDVKADVSIPRQMPTEIISKGEIVRNNLLQLDLTEDWLQHKLKAENVKSIEDVYFAQVLENGSLYISLYDHKKESSYK